MESTEAANLHLGQLLETACRALEVSVANMVVLCYQAVEKEEEEEIKESMLDALEMLLPLHLTHAAVESGALEAWPSSVPMEMQALCTYDTTREFLVWSGIAADWKAMCRFEDELLPLVREVYPDAAYEWNSVTHGKDIV